MAIIVTQNQVVDIIYNAVNTSISKHFDETNRTQPQGKRLFFLIKEGIVNGVATVATILPIPPGARSSSDPPVEGEIPHAEETAAPTREETFAAPI